MTTPDANDLLFGGGAPAASFDTLGVVVKGTIVDTATNQQRDFKTKEPLYWGSDKRPTTTVTDQPMMQAILTVQTDQRDPDIFNDDGQRRIFLGGRNIRDAVRDAVIKTGRKALEVGGTVAIQWTGGKGETGDPKQFIAEYAPPAVGVGLLGGDQPVTSAPAAEPQRPTSLLGG